MNSIMRVSCNFGVSAGCHINDVMNCVVFTSSVSLVSAGCHINDVMNKITR